MRTGILTTAVNLVSTVDATLEVGAIVHLGDLGDVAKVSSEYLHTGLSF